MSIPLLKMENIKLTLENFTLSNINVDLMRSEIHVIMGENGSGKSLLMQLICGLLAPDSGHIYKYGKKIKNSGLLGAQDKDIIYVRQDSDMLNSLSVAENLFFHKLPYKNNLLKIIDFDQLESMCQNLIDEFNLPLSVFDDVASLGLAQRQIIKFCRAYISDAKIVILDEPYAALTQSECELLYRIVRRMKAKGAGIFYITHRLEDVQVIGDRITIIKKGKLVGTKIVSQCSHEEIIKMLSDHYIKNRYPRIRNPKGQTILSVRNLGYEDKLENINFDLHKGEILGVTGLAGSGRTLLANCLFGAVSNVQGKIVLNDLETKIYDPYAAIANGIAFVSENRFSDSIFSDLDTNDNIALASLKRFADYLIINGSILKQAVQDYLHKLNIIREPRADIMELSAGNLQKVIFARWIMNRAKVFILDEPTRGLDIASKIDIYNYINDLIKKQVAVLFISSDIEEILGFCDRVAVLANRTLVCNVATHEISVEQILELATRTDTDRNSSS